MPTITINGKVCEFEGKPTVLQVALENGIEIPHYCYHEGLSIVASCRICLAEVWAPNPRNDNRLEPIPKLLPTCQTPAGDGQKVFTDSPKSLANQKAVMEYLLINHPLDCPICDQAGECYLQDYSYQYGRSVSRFQEDKIKQPKKDLGPTMWLYSDRCIMCSRCVRFTREVTGTSELCVVGRGAHEQIDLFPGVALDNPLSGNVADICPVGALLDKDFLFTQRVWLLKPTASIDGITASGDNISIEHNEGRIYRVKPRRNLEVNKWWISDEIRYGFKFVHEEARLNTPMRNQYGEQSATTFAAAYEEVNAEFRKALRGGKQLGVMISPMLSCEDAFLTLDYIDSLAADQRDQVVVAVGPVPFQGEDQTFPPGASPEDEKAYTIWAEKAPNARGVRRVISAFLRKWGREDTMPMEFDGFVESVKNCDAVLLTGNYPSEWPTADLTKAIGTKKFTVCVDTLPNSLTRKSNIVLPACTWVEKEGTFENVSHRLQAFDQALMPLEGTRAESQMMLELSRMVAGEAPTRAPKFDAAVTRARMVNELGLQEFMDEVHLPSPQSFIEPDMVLQDL